MQRIITFLLFTILFLISSACSTTQSPDAKANAVSSADTNAPANLPPGLSTSPVPLSNKATPGIPDPKTLGNNNTAKPAAPTPGIPDPKTIGKMPLSKGSAPTPGIPDAATLKKQMGNLMKDANVANIPTNTDSSPVKKPTDKTPMVRKP